MRGSVIGCGMRQWSVAVAVMQAYAAGPLMRSPSDLNLLRYVGVLWSCFYVVVPNITFWVLGLGLFGLRVGIGIGIIIGVGVGVGVGVGNGGS